MQGEPVYDASYQCCAKQCVWKGRIDLDEVDPEEKDEPTGCVSTETAEHCHWDEVVPASGGALARPYYFVVVLAVGQLAW